MRNAKMYLVLPAAALALGFVFLGAPTPTATAGGDADKASELLWRKKCASCHGRDGKGQTKKGKKAKVEDMTTAKWQKEVTDERMIKSMTDGIDRVQDGVKQEMKPSKLSPAEMQSLVKYMRAFKK